MYNCMYVHTVLSEGSDIGTMSIAAVLPLHSGIFTSLCSPGAVNWSMV